MFKICVSHRNVSKSPCYYYLILTNYHSHADVEEHHTAGKNTQEEASANQHGPSDGGHPGS